MLPDRIHGGSRENLLDFTIGRCYSIRMYHNVSDVYIIDSNSFKDGSCYFSHQPILRRIYQTGMRWSRLWERHMFSKGFTLVSGTRKSNASSLLVEPYTLPRYQGPIMGKGDKQHKYLSIPKRSNSHIPRNGRNGGCHRTQQDFRDLPNNNFWCSKV